jgi:hypothetical protein
MAVDQHNVDKAREMIVNKLLAQIVKEIVDPIVEKHKNDKDCVKISYEGTAKPIPADSSVDFDIKGHGLHFHIEHLKTDELLKDWVVKIDEETVYNTSHKGCTGADDLPQTINEDVTVEYEKGTVLFKDNKHPDSDDKDDAIADAKCKIKFRVTLLVQVRRTKCYTVVRVESLVPGEEALVAVGPREVGPEIPYQPPADKPMAG